MIWGREEKEVGEEEKERCEEAAILEEEESSEISPSNSAPGVICRGNFIGFIVVYER